MLEAKREVFKLLERYLAVILEKDFGHCLDHIDCCNVAILEQILEFLPLDDDLRRVLLLRLLRIQILSIVRAWFVRACTAVFLIKLTIAAFSFVEAMHSCILISPGRRNIFVLVIFIDWFKQIGKCAFCIEILFENSPDFLDGVSSVGTVAIETLVVIWHYQWLLELPFLLLSALFVCRSFNFFIIQVDLAED